jgi:hypothetical protein
MWGRLVEYSWIMQSLLLLDLCGLLNSRQFLPHSFDICLGTVPCTFYTARILGSVWAHCSHELHD